MSLYCTQRRFLLLLVFIMATTPAVAEESVKSLVQGMSRRRNAIQTGTFKYTWGLATVADINKPGPWEVWEDFKKVKPTILTIAGNEWIVRWSNSSHKKVHRNSFDAKYSCVPQKNGTTIHKCLLSPPNENVETLIDHSVQFRILAAGTIPYARLMDYLKRNQKKAVDRGKVTIDGVQTHLLEWKIPKRDYGVLGSMNPVLSQKFRSTLLRVYIIPEMGYVVRRLDLCTPKGKKAQMTDRYESDNFKEVAKGIYFPWNYYWIRNYHDFPPHEGYSVDQFTVMDVTGVNKTVPESDFEITVPKGTRVTDYRPGRGGKKFYTGKTITFSQVNDLIRDDAPSKKSQKPSSSNLTKDNVNNQSPDSSTTETGFMSVAIVVNVIAAVILVFAVVIFQRKKRANRQ